MTNIKIIIVACAMISLVACAKKHKPDETVVSNEALSPVSDTDIQAKDMNTNPYLEGSDSGKIEGLYTVNFEYDKSTLTPEAREKAAKDAAWIKAHADQHIQIEGHCDRHGSIEYNLALGERRANAVKKYLVNLGVDAERLSTISYGKERLLDQTESDIADAKNRRGNFKTATAPVENKRM